MQDMRTLPSETKEAILEALVDSYDDDPAYQWTQLRHLSSTQKRRIERRFQHFWLPKLTISLYCGVWLSVDYAYDSTDAQPKAEFTTFKFDPDSYRADEDVLSKMWAGHSAENPGKILRLGEGFLKRGLKGGYIVNDSELPGLELSDDYLVVRFKWHGALDALFREEMLLRKYRDGVLQTARQEFADLGGSVEETWACNKYLLKRLALSGQMASRVAVVRHRFARENRTATFNEWSQTLHGQQATKKLMEAEESRGCFCCSRIVGPDIFEIVHQEESMVLALAGWERLGSEMLLELYAEEFDWRCCIVQGQREGVEFQQQRKKGWMGTREDAERALARLTARAGFDPLG